MSTFFSPCQWFPRLVLFLLSSATLWALQVAQPTHATAVRAWEGEMALPTTVEQSPSPNAPFDVFAGERFNYPYTIRDALTDERRVERYHALFLENDFLKVTVLPELGGHLYSCLDKISGRQMFYANRSIKKALIGYRGAWAAFGIEFNFPVSHNWMSMSPVDSALMRNADGSASIWVGNVDAVFGSSWRVELRLRPGRAVLEQHTTLFNTGDARHRYYWWTNAAVEVQDDSELVYPTHLMATHGFTAIQPWPIHSEGRDLRIIRNQTGGPVSLFTHKTREPFIGVWHPSTRTGTMRVASPDELPTSKVWSWGFDSDAHAWREALSDDRSAYVELQSGLFRNQETYAFLGPQERVSFSEYWLPVHEMDGVTRATVDAVFHATRNASAVTFALSSTRSIPGARVAVRQGDRVVFDTSAALVARQIWQRQLADLPADEPWSFELRDAKGRLLLHHEEGRYDALTPKEVPTGPQKAHRAPPSEQRSDGDFVELGQDAELNGRRLEALQIYRSGLARFADSLELNKAAGRLATSLHWPEARSVDPSRDNVRDALTWLERAYRRDTTDMEIRYYLGLARAALGDHREAREQLEAAQRFAQTSAPARLQLARLAAREGKRAEAVARIEALIAANPENLLAGATEVTLLRLEKQVSRARERCAHWLQQDPTSSLLRFEAIRLGTPDPALWTHLAADGNRLLTLVDHYLALGALADAWVLLDHAYPEVAPPAAEPGARSLSANPLIAYYRAFVGKTLGRVDVDDAYRRASDLDTTYVFPNRASSYAVLDAALAANPDDGTARFLRGSLYLSSGLSTSAIADWQRARTISPDLPTLHRNLGMTLLHEGKTTEAIEVLKEGIAHDARNVEVYTALDQAYGAAGASVAERSASLERHPDVKTMPPVLVYKLALARAEAGSLADAESLFRNRFFPREEGGMTPERVVGTVRVVAARATSRAGRCEDALKELDALSAVAGGMTLDSKAIERATQDPAMQFEIADVESRCGRESNARERRQALARSAGRKGSLASVVAADADRVSGQQASTDTVERLQAIVNDLTATLEEGDSGTLGLTAYTRARALRALGGDGEARQALARVFAYPDRATSYLLARLLREDLEVRR